MGSSIVTVNTKVINNMADFVKNVDVELHKVVVQTAIDGAALSSTLAPRQTGATQETIYPAYQGSDNYGQAASIAATLRPTTAMADEEKIEDPLESAWIAPLDYAEPLEMGTSRMAARPFMLPAASQMEQPFVTNCSAAVNQAAKDSEVS